MVIAGILISAKVVIDNYSSFSGSSALTKKVQTFFLQIVRNVAERWQYLDPEQNLEIKLGKLVLRMDARGPYGNETVSWTVVSDYAAQMAAWAVGGFLGFFEGAFQFFVPQGGVWKMGVLWMAFRFFN